MSLSVHAFVMDDDGEMTLFDGEEPGSGLAGFESTRTDLWGSETVRSLGARFLPTLDGADLYVMPEDVDGFLAECEMVRENIPAITAATGRPADYVAHRLGNIIDAAHRAKSLGGGVVVW
ncbi:hypothetical protein [Actinomadura rugatobispora]|uniref:Uncharacterized protein n=1 Tax=Actinomadura rugatobispora TaxID=1994 RepID=A0ABW1AEY6_9ACTN